MFLMTDELVLDICEMDGDMKVCVQVRRFNYVPGARVSHGFLVAVARMRTNEPAMLDEMAIFEPSDVFSVALHISQHLRDKLERILLDSCFGVFGYASYLFFSRGADFGFEVLMTVARIEGGYALRVGGEALVAFKELDELRAMLPPFGVEGERGYEDARAALIMQAENTLR